MPKYLAWRIMTGKLDYDIVIAKYGQYKEDIDTILAAEGWEHG